MLYIAFALGLAAAVSGQATRCCMPTKWSATMTDVREVARGNQITADFFYDFDQKSLAMQFYRFGDTREDINRIVTKYDQAVRYTIDPDGTCEKRALTGEAMLSNCIPASATYMGSNYIGEEGTGLKYDGWKFPLGNLNLTMAFSDPGCVPIIEGVAGSVTSGDVNAAYFFNGFKKGITKPDAFKIPAGC